MNNTFDVKWYTDSTLAYWVKQGVANRVHYTQVVLDHLTEIVETRERKINAQCTMRWTMFDWGWVIETTRNDSMMCITTVETLISYCGKDAVIVNRFRFGRNHSKTTLYARDHIYPVASIVRLLP